MNGAAANLPPRRESGVAAQSTLPRRDCCVVETSLQGKHSAHGCVGGLHDKVVVFSAEFASLMAGILVHRVLAVVRVSSTVS